MRKKEEDFYIDDFTTKEDLREMEKSKKSTKHNKKKKRKGKLSKRTKIDIVGVIMSILVLSAVAAFGVYRWMGPKTNKVPEPIKVETGTLITPTEDPNNVFSNYTKETTESEYYHHYDKEGLTPVLNTYSTYNDKATKLASFMCNEIIYGGDQMYYVPTVEELELFIRVTEAEVCGSYDPSDEYKWPMSEKEAYECKLHVAQVIVNRILSNRFPNTLGGVIRQPNAFSPLLDGRYLTVSINSITAVACRDALRTSVGDTVQGALFFNVGTTNPYGPLLFTDKTGHSFFGYYD
jgi:hypothetical protein